MFLIFVIKLFFVLWLMQNASRVKLIESLCFSLLKCFLMSNPRREGMLKI